MTTKLEARFSIPKTQVKNANTPLMHIVAAQKSAWIRSYSEQIWAKEAKEQFNITAIEPKPSELKEFPISDEVKTILQDIEEIDKELEEVLTERTIHDGLLPQYKKWKTELRVAKKDNNESLFEELEESIHSYEKKLATLKASAQRLKASKAAIKKRTSKEVSKELRKVEGNKRKDYISKKLELNSHQQLFEECAVIVRVSNITAHKFDAANFYPTVKAILDGATDTGIIWPDDNNDIIKGGVLFLDGGKSEDKEYKFDIEIISDWAWS